MNRIAIILIMSVISYVGYGQNASTEDVIRNLEQLECKAALEKDTSTLRKLWADDFTVNSPANGVVTGGRNTLDRPVINQAENVSFTREVEHIMIKEGYAVAMGNETVVPKSKGTTPAVPVKRRYTNVWMLQKGEWKLTARHANIICK
jgi:hypothetical protein